MRWTPPLLLLGVLAVGVLGSPLTGPVSDAKTEPVSDAKSSLVDAKPSPVSDAKADPVPSPVSDLASDAKPSPVSDQATPALHEQARQAPAAPAADDDDDDDDDDDIDLDLDDDDDDDDDDDEDDDTADDDDDDDEDYFERFFDDILGEGDDDDDDDTPSVAATQPLAAVPQPVAAAPVAAVAASVAAAAEQQPAVRPGSALPDDINPADYDESADSPSYDEEEQAAEELSANTPVTIDLTPDPDQGLKDKPQVVATPAPPAAPIAIAPAPVAAVAATFDDDDDEDDDDDDEDDFDVDLTADDDDDDDDEDDDDEDDDDDDEDDDEDELEDVVGDGDIGAKRSRAMSASKPSTMPPIYISKYNRFVDNILSRINRVLKKNYDPVNVRLHPSPDSKNNKKKNKKKSGAGHKTREGGNHTLPTNSSSATKKKTDTAELAAAVAAVSEQLAGEQKPSQRLVPVHMVQKRGRRANNNRASNNNRNKVKKNPGRNRPGARAMLYGLSTLKRDGDVTVNMMSSHNTVKTKFTLGPLMLKVEKEFGRGAKKDIRSATATTTEMSGRMNLRVVHGGAATLHSIRVLQPRQVRVESLDDHDKTREYVWRRSSNIARVVSQKLTNATRSMLQPPPVSTNFMSSIFS